MNIRKIADNALLGMGVAAMRLEKFRELQNGANELSKLRIETEFLLALDSPHSRDILKNLRRSNSQILQDLFVLHALNFKRNGFFVEFGATNGISLSNTYLLEDEFGWTGILAEPARCWHEALRANRSVHIELNCVWSDSTSVLSFNQVDNGELSTIDSYSGSDSHSSARRNGTQYQVRTISLLDLLKKYEAPKIIDYLSIDTEGSEYEILENFDFDGYCFRVVTCEHNHTAAREKLFKLFSSYGYKRVHQEISNFDDWYLGPATPE